MHAADAELLHRRNRELSILNSIAEALNRSVGLHEALQAALAQVAELLNLQTGWIWLIHEETQTPYLAAAQNLPPALACNPARMDGSKYCYCLDTYANGDLEGAANVNVVECSRLDELVDGTDGLRYHASIPLYAHETQLGLLNVARPDWFELSDDDLRLLHTIGDLLSIAIERAQLFARSTALGAVEERNRLARELHDTLAQGLTAVVLQLETADALLQANAEPEKVQARLRQALALTRANLEEARRSVLDLRAAPLEGRSLAEALLVLTGQVAGANAITVQFEPIDAAQPLPLRIEVGIYRMVQEALNNILHHAAASHVLVRLTVTPAEVDVLIEDNGSGFDPAQVDRERFGLIGMNERARLLGGQLRVETAPGAGTRLAIQVPLEHRQ